MSNILNKSCLFNLSGGFLRSLEGSVFTLQCGSREINRADLSRSHLTLRLPEIARNWSETDGEMADKRFGGGTPLEELKQLLVR
jgi:hypothetical protein